jgi:hypothetical protein
MIQNNMSEIRCPCHRCNLRALIKPDSRTLEKHLLMSGFIKGYIDEDINNRPPPAGNGDVGGRREGEESPRHDEGDAGHDHYQWRIHVLAVLSSDSTGFLQIKYPYV